MLQNANLSPYQSYYIRPALQEKYANIFQDKNLQNTIWFTNKALKCKNQYKNFKFQ